jgi:hypothetical protein
MGATQSPESMPRDDSNRCCGPPPSRRHRALAALFALAEGEFARAHDRAGSSSSAAAAAATNDFDLSLANATGTLEAVAAASFGIADAIAWARAREGPLLSADAIMRERRMSGYKRIALFGGISLTAESRSAVVVGDQRPYVAALVRGQFVAGVPGVNGLLRNGWLTEWPLERMLFDWDCVDALAALVAAGRDATLHIQEDASETVVAEIWRSMHFTGGIGAFVMRSAAMARAWYAAGRELLRRGAPGLPQPSGSPHETVESAVERTRRYVCAAPESMRPGLALMAADEVENARCGLFFAMSAAAVDAALAADGVQSPPGAPWRIALLRRRKLLRDLLWRDSRPLAALPISTMAQLATLDSAALNEHRRFPTSAACEALTLALRARCAASMLRAVDDGAGAPLLLSHFNSLLNAAAGAAAGAENATCESLLCDVYCGAERDGLARVQRALPPGAATTDHLMMFAHDQRLAPGSPAFAPADEFAARWRRITGGALDGFACDYAFAFGDAVAACLQPDASAHANMAATMLAGCEIDVAFVGLSTPGVSLALLQLDRFLSARHGRAVAVMATSVHGR